MKLRNLVMLTAITAAYSVSTLAAVSAEEAKQLGTTLTLTGAEKAGNKEGTIPAYSGEPVKTPASYNPKDPGQHPDPFNEKPLFSINAQNYTKYADKLDGSAEMFKRFPNFRMDVYPSHRNYLYPKWHTDNTIKNATVCKATNNELKLEGCYAGFPFPIPKTGNQAMWNHLTQYEGRTIEGVTDNYVIPPAGSPALQGLIHATQSTPFFDPNRKTPQPSDTVYWQVRTNDPEPARKAGGHVLLIDSLDSVKQGRRAWQYIPSQRRVKLAPDLAYDTLSPYAGGAATMDDQKGFLGGLDRYDFTLVGKKEKYIPYDNYALFDRTVCPGSKVYSTKNYIHPDCVRWELHRVWVIEATLKTTFRHIYKTRKFYYDEDVPGHGVIENFDAGGQLYRIVNTVLFPFYENGIEGGGVGGTGEVNTDLTTGIANTTGLGGCNVPGYSCGWSNVADHPAVYFSPEGLTGEGIR